MGVESWTLLPPPLYGEGGWREATDGWGTLVRCAESPDYPTLAALRPVPPHEGEGVDLGPHQFLSPFSSAVGMALQDLGEITPGPALVVGGDLFG